MKRMALLIGLAWLAACSFPNFNIEGGDGSGDTNSAVSPCSDGERNGAETGLDCGMDACSKVCPVGQGCDTINDCNGGACLRGICQAESCTDELENALESDVDCGGDGGCRRCATDERCHTVADCDGGLCTNGLCRAGTCKDNLQNGTETDVDCGGPTCDPCDEGRSCLESRDCDNVACVKGKCQPRGCSDGVKNQNETDLDCGGSCPSPCADELRCKAAEDCESRVCSPSTLRCAAPACDDGVLNGSEPTQDCGASCAKKCTVLDACAVAEDCASASCSSELCLPTAPTNEILSMWGWTAKASHEFLPNAGADKAIDGSLGTDWITGTWQVPNMWFEVDMQARQVFYSIELIIDSADDAGDAPELVDVALSSDGIYTGKVLKNVAGEQKLRIDFTEPQVARFIMISLSPGVSKEKWWRMDELRVRQ
jgi:hypothetical protein